MLGKDYVILAVGVVSGVAAFLRYSEIGIPAALMVMFAVSYLLWRFTDPSRAFYTVGYLKSPPIAAFMTFLICFLYLSFQGYSSANTWLYSFGVALLGGLISVILNTIWTIDG